MTTGMAVTLLPLLACDGKPPADPAAPRASCAELMAEPGDPGSEAGIQAALDGVQASLYPELHGVSVGLVAMESDSDYFYANLELSTLPDPPLERQYLVFYSTLMLPDPPSHAAVVAILAHELKHVADYTTMDAAELAEFGLWYATTDDISGYERATDEHALALGCGPGLIEYRQWLYEHVDEQTRAEKQRDYYTPEEIEAWMAAND